MNADEILEHLEKTSKKYSGVKYEDLPPDIQQQIRGEQDDLYHELLKSVDGIQATLERRSSELGLSYEKVPSSAETNEVGLSQEEKAKNSIVRFLKSASPTFPIVNGAKLIVKRGEVIHEYFPASSMYESISASNTNLKFVDCGDLYITNKRFAFVHNTQVRSLPYREIEVFSSDWIPESGRIRISSSARARVTEFQVSNTLRASFYFSFYTNPSFAMEFKNAGDLRNDTEERKELIESYYRKAKSGFERKAEESARLEEPTTSATGCSVPTIVWILMIIFSVIALIKLACG